MCLIPFRIAIAAQEDGWWCRSVIIWSKPNPMPESVTDRPTESHEYILMLTKSKKYYWDADAVRESWKPNESDIARALDGGYRYQGKHKDGYSKASSRDDHLNAYATGQPIGDPTRGRNIRSVWEFPTQPYPEAHFAVFPEKLPETCIKAATPEVGCCSKCGTPWERITIAPPEYSQHRSFRPYKENLDLEAFHLYLRERREKKNMSRIEVDNAIGTNTAYAWWEGRNYLGEFRQQVPSPEMYARLKIALDLDNRFDKEIMTYHKAQNGWVNKASDVLMEGNRKAGKSLTRESTTLGWQPTYKCNADKVPSIVLDPFGGAGTTPWVAKKLGRRCYVYELSEEYCELIVERNRHQANEHPQT